MHMLVRLLVEADNAKEALALAESDADDLVERGEFDYHSFDGRWGKSEAYLATSKEGKKHIDDAMAEDKQEFTSGLAAIRYMLENFSDEDIYEENFPKHDDIKDKLPEGVYHLSRWNFTQASGNSHGPAVYSEGSKVDNQKSLRYQFEYAKNKLWVVPVDFHY